MRACAFLMALCAMSVAKAEERFYQFIDASGRIQTIRQDVPQDAAEKDERSASGAGSAPVPTPEKQFAPAAMPMPAKAKSTQKSEPPYAAYDGDEYLDSEVMDDSHAMSAPARKRFYVVNDGVGQRVENMDGAAEGFAVPAVAASDEVDYIELRDEYMQPSDVKISDVESGCLSSAQVKSAKALELGKLADLVFDKQLANYVKAGHLAETYRIEGRGFRSVSLRSYARTDIDPAFAMPLIAFASEKGCITRIADGYFQRYFPATKSKHAMLEASLVLHSDDVYVLLVMPVMHKGRAGFKPQYGISSLGRVSIKWQP